MKLLLGAAAFLIATSISLTTSAHDYTLGSLTLHHPWARASIGQAKSGAAYLTIVNAGTEVDRLTAAETTAAKAATLHTHLMDGGVMKMRPAAAVEIAPGEPVVFQPGGLHIMLTGLKTPLVTGGSFPLILSFEKAGRIEVQVTIEAPAAMRPALTGDHGRGP